MRLKITLRLDHPAYIPLSHTHLLQAAIYRILGGSSPEFSTWLHDDGYHDATRTGGHRRVFKLFCFSNLRIPAHSRRIEGDQMRLRPCLVTWYVASPMMDMMQHLVTGLFSEPLLAVGQSVMAVEAIEAMAEPDFSACRAAFTCLTPIVAGVADPDGRKTQRYLRPTEGERFGEVVRVNLLSKHRLVHGQEPRDDRLFLTFDSGYLERDRHQGTKKITFKTIDVVGALAPFTLEADPAMLRLAWLCGVGAMNSMGFGMVALDERGEK